MKKYDSILKRVEQIEYKLGINYAKTKGKLYSSMRVINLLGVIYLFGINFLFCVSALMNSANGNQIVSNQTVILISIATLLEITGVIFSFTDLKIVGGILGILPLPYLTFVFAKLCEGYTSGWFGYTLNFYVRHLSSYVFILIASGFMLFIALRQKIKTNREYKRIINNIYVNYKNQFIPKDSEVSDEDWEQFIEDYDPRAMR